MDASRKLRPALIAGCAIGAASGWFLTPSTHSWIGLGVGTAIGGLIAAGTHAWLSKRKDQAEGSPPLGLIGHGVYLLGFICSLFLLWLACATWITYPEKWLGALAGLVFAGTGAVAITILWQLDRSLLPAPRLEGQRYIVLGVCCFVLIVPSALSIIFGEVLFGSLGVIFFLFGGFVLVRRGRSLFGSRDADG